MACLFGHKWNGCKCQRCGKTRDEGHRWEGGACLNCPALTSDISLLIETAKNGKFGTSMRCYKKLCEINPNAAIEIAKDIRVFDQDNALALCSVRDKRVVPILFASIGQYILSGSHSGPIGSQAFRPNGAVEIYESMYANFREQALLPLYASSQGWFLNENGTFKYSLGMMNSHSRTMTVAQHFAFLAGKVIKNVPAQEIRTSFEANPFGFQIPEELRAKVK